MGMFAGGGGDNRWKEVQQQKELGFSLGWLYKTNHAITLRKEMDRLIQLGQLLDESGNTMAIHLCGWIECGA